MNVKGRNKKNQAKVLNIFEQQDIIEKAEALKGQFKASTWKDLEAKGKFGKNEKLSFITDEMLIVGCDIGSETHYLRVIDSRGRELSAKAFPFSNSEKGFSDALDWLSKIAAANDKQQIVIGLEPTGHYWFCLATWMISKGISVVQVNPYAVKQTKEIEDNSQNKDDRKDPKVIANLVKDGNYGMPYLPEGLYADFRRLSMLRDQLNEDRIRCINRLHREMTIYFPEYKDAFGKFDGPFCIELLKTMPFPEDIRAAGINGIKEVWRTHELIGRGYAGADKIYSKAQNSIGLTDGIDSARIAVEWFAKEVSELSEKIKEVNKLLEEKCKKIPYAENILDISGIGENIISGIIAEMGDVSRFDNDKEIQKLSGLGLVACSSGKHKGETKISHRGRKKLRYWLFHAAKSAVAHSPEFKELHVYYTTRKNNPLKRLQSLIVIACKILRVIYAILTKGTTYDPNKLLADIKRPQEELIAA